MIIAERLTVAENAQCCAEASAADGAYQVVALMNPAARRSPRSKRQVYAISDFSDSVTQISKTIADLKKSSDQKLKALAPLMSTPEFQIRRLARLNKTRDEVELNPNQEIDRLEASLSEIAKGQDPFARERGEIERAIKPPDGNLFPYRLYVPRVTTALIRRRWL